MDKTYHIILSALLGTSAVYATEEVVSPTQHPHHKKHHSAQEDPLKKIEQIKKNLDALQAKLDKQKRRHHSPVSA